MRSRKFAPTQKEATEQEAYKWSPMKEDFTLVLRPREKKRYVAGPYDADGNQPRYEFSLSAPEHVKCHVVAKQFLLETGDGYHWAWDFENSCDSQFPVFVMVKKDGQLIPCEQSL